MHVKSGGLPMMWAKTGRLTEINFGQKKTTQFCGHQKQFERIENANL